MWEEENRDGKEMEIEKDGNGARWRRMQMEKNGDGEETGHLEGN